MSDGHGDNHPGRAQLPEKLDEQQRQQAAEIASFLKALGHDGRWLILASLMDNDLTVTELETLIHSRQAAVSQQLARLRQERLVSARRDGNQIIYSLADDRVRRLIPLLREIF